MCYLKNGILNNILKFTDLDKILMTPRAENLWVEREI